jgi:universal stress protein E
MDQLKTILVAVDFSPCSADAFRQAARIAAWNRATLSAVHVINMPVLDPLYPVELQSVDELEAQARDDWKAFAPGCEAVDATPLAVEVGNPRRTILDVVRRDRPDLLVIGAHSELDAGRGIGGTAAACAQRAATRVLIVRENQHGPFRSVLACVDFSQTSRVALEHAIQVAAQDDAELHILHVYQDPWRGRPIPAAIEANMPDFAGQYRRSTEERVRVFCEPFGHELNALKAGFHAHQSLSHGEGIIAFAQRHGCDLVILGTKASWSVHDFFWGSTAERVVRECPSCVLAVKPPGFRQQEPLIELGQHQSLVQL